MRRGYLFVNIPYIWNKTSRTNNGSYNTTNCFEIYTHTAILYLDEMPHHFMVRHDKGTVIGGIRAAALPPPSYIHRKLVIPNEVRNLNLSLNLNLYSAVYQITALKLSGLYIASPCFTLKAV